MGFGDLRYSSGLVLVLVSALALGIGVWLGLDLEIGVLDGVCYRIVDWRYLALGLGIGVLDDIFLSSHCELALDWDWIWCLVFGVLDGSSLP